MSEQELKQLEDSLVKQRQEWLQKQLANIWLAQYLDSLYPLGDAPYSTKPLAHQIKYTLGGHG